MGWVNRGHTSERERKKAMGIIVSMGEEEQAKGERKPNRAGIGQVTRVCTPQREEKVRDNERESMRWGREKEKEEREA